MRLDQDRPSGSRANLISEMFRDQAAAIEREEQDSRRRLLDSSFEALRRDACDEPARLEAIHQLRKLNRHEEALAALDEGIRVLPESQRLHRQYISVLETCNRTEEAVDAASRAARIFPGELWPVFREHLLLPLIYQSPSEIERWRTRYEAGLEILSGRIRLTTAEERASALHGLAAHSNVFLAYQAKNDRDLAVKYGELATRIMGACFPELMAGPEVSAGPPDLPLRIGYVSSRFRDVGSGHYFLGWLRNHDPRSFSLYTWHLGTKADDVTEQVRAISHRFRHDRRQAQEIARDIRACNLDVLVFLDIGIDPLMTQLGALRVAPVQCMAWDHPTTSGLPNMDYALTSAGAEPANGDTHYSETLVLLPGLGVPYRRLVPPAPLLRRSRASFGLREASVVYLCCQSFYKFLPQYDSIFPRIARLVPDAQFVFITSNELAEMDFRRRLDRAFAAEGTSAESHCVFLPQLKRLDYWNLHRHGDVFLDTVGWSSGVSALEAAGMSVPVVTLPADLMRGRQAMAMLEQLDIRETIAADLEDYIRIAVRLGSDRGAREAVVAKMRQGFSGFFDDPRPLVALETFYERITRGGVPKPLQR